MYEHSETFVSVIEDCKAILGAAQMQYRNDRVWSDLDIVDRRYLIHRAGLPREMAGCKFSEFDGVQQLAIRKAARRAVDLGATVRGMLE